MSSQLTRDRKTFDPNLKQIHYDDEIRTPKGWRKASDVEADAFIVAMATPAFTGLRLLMNKTPDRVKQFIAYRCVDAFAHIHTQNPLYAENLLNNWNEFLTKTDEELEADLQNSNDKNSLGILVPLNFVVTLRDFITDIRDRALPHLPPPAIIEG